MRLVVLRGRLGFAQPREFAPARAIGPAGGEPRGAWRNLTTLKPTVFGLEALPATSFTISTS